jgi:hypothetical protein
MKDKIFNLLSKLPGVWSYYYNDDRILYVFVFGKKWEVWK